MPCDPSVAVGECRKLRDEPARQLFLEWLGNFADHDASLATGFPEFKFVHS
jgi:hypothetical protein